MFQPNDDDEPAGTEVACSVVSSIDMMGAESKGRDSDGLHLIAGVSLSLMIMIRAGRCWSSISMQTEITGDRKSQCSHHYEHKYL